MFILKDQPDLVADTKQIHVEKRFGAISLMPEMEIVLLDRPDQPALGAGEPSTVTTAPAVANAVFDATGVRLRQMPFTPERVREALLAESKVTVKCFAPWIEYTEKG